MAHPSVGSMIAIRTMCGPTKPASNASWARAGSCSVGIRLRASSASKVGGSKGMAFSVSSRVCCLGDEMDELPLQTPTSQKRDVGHPLLRGRGETSVIYHQVSDDAPL